MRLDIASIPMVEDERKGISDFSDNLWAAGVERGS
jgi:hypothetical protein